MSDEEGQFPLSSLNKWERDVVDTELSRPNAVGWYRNPSRAAVDSLGIAYRDGKGNWRSMHPDFIFFHEINGQIKASIVDPHGHHLEDAVTKLRALAEFAEKYGESFYRIEAISQVDNSMRVLDMQESAVRDAVRHRNDSAVDFYHSDIAVDYDTSKVHAHNHAVNH
jgi:hypothetical protein